MYLAGVLLGVCLLVAALVLTWLYGIRLYDVTSRRGHPRDHPLFHTGHADRVVALTIDDAPWQYRLPLGVELATSIKEIGEVCWAMRIRSTRSCPCPFSSFGTS
jgi:hypothetical protein